MERSGFAGGDAGSLIETLFNGDRFPELADKYLYAKVQVIPQPDGSIDSLNLAIRMMANKPSTAQIMDDDEDWLVNDYSNPYIQELKECVQLIPAWDYIKIRGEVRPISMYPKLWEGKGCKAICPVYLRLQNDEIKMKGKVYQLKNYPLQYDMNLYARLRPLLRDEFSFHCLRGYRATWEIRKGKLYLLSLQRATSGEAIPLDVVFPGNDGSPVEATWYTGKLHLWGGGELKWYYSAYRDEVFIDIEAGKTKRKVVYHNFIREGDQAAQKRAEQAVADYDWGQFPELQGKTVRCRYQVFPRKNGKADSIKVAIDTGKARDWRNEQITDPNHPYVRICLDALKSVKHWNIISIRGKIRPVARFIFSLKAKDSNNCTDPPVR